MDYSAVRREAVLNKHMGPKSLPVSKEKGIRAVQAKGILGKVVYIGLISSRVSEDRRTGRLSVSVGLTTPSGHT